jgi:two-component system cell cycle sensor histidine kinase/response regulator CckA
MKRIDNINNASAIEEKFKVAAHDLNNLLNNVLAGIEILKENFKSNNADKIFNHIEKNTLLASQIIQQLSSYESFSSEIKSIVNIVDIIEETIELLDNDTKKQINFEFPDDKEEFMIWGNYTEIKRVLLNLIINAKEASVNKGSINLNISNTEKNYVMIAIKDNGSGIPSNLISKIFDKEFSTKSKDTQRGYGLSIVKEIIDDHKGKINVFANESIGTTFELYFPKNKIEEEQLDYTSKSVVIAEDDDFQREVLKDLLKTLKFNVFTASNGLEALNTIISTSPDLLFIDENMPGMSGVQCSEKIRENNKELPIVLVTGASIEKNMFEAKISKVLKKPYTFDMIQSTIKELLP